MIYLTRQNGRLNPSPNIKFRVIKLTLLDIQGDISLKCAPYKANILNHLLVDLSPIYISFCPMKIGHVGMVLYQSIINTLGLFETPQLSIGCPYIRTL